MKKTKRFLITSIVEESFVFTVKDPETAQTIEVPRNCDGKRFAAPVSDPKPETQLPKKGVSNMRSISSYLVRLFFIFTIVFFCSVSVESQGTGFTYQGKLAVSATNANGSFDFEFLLFDSESGGSQLGSTIAISNVTITNSVFSVDLNFGSLFPGANRFLEIRVRQSGGGAFTPLAPRQQINSSPYSIKSLSADTALNATSAATAANATNAATAANALQLGGVAANQYVLTGDARLSDARNPLPGSSSYIQNTTNPQASSNFNISGTGTANIFNAGTQFNIGGVGVLNVSGTQNTFVGPNAASSNPGSGNTFVGDSAGIFSANGGRNTLLGAFSSFSATNITNATAIGFRAYVTQGDSLVLGSIAGVNGSADGTNVGIGTTAPNHRLHVVGNGLFDGNLNVTNSLDVSTEFRLGGTRVLKRGATGSLFLGNGGANTVQILNSFFGINAGLNTTFGAENTFVGANAGQNNIDGGSNTFIGTRSGLSNLGGQGNTLLGWLSDVGPSVHNSTAIGQRSLVTQSNSLVLGSINGVNGSTNNTNVGIGTTAPVAKLHIGVGTGQVLIGDSGCGAGFGGIGFANTLNGCANYSLLGNDTNTFVNRPTGGGLFFRENNADQMVIESGGNVGIGISNPNAKLTVSGGGFGANVHVVDSNVTATTLDLANTSTGASNWRFQSVGSGVPARVGNFELWKVDGPVGLTADPDGLIGVGTTLPNSKFHVADNGGQLLFGGGGCPNGTNAIGFAANLNCTNYSLLGDGIGTSINASSTGSISFG
jgi:hypothetical protein